MEMEDSFKPAVGLELGMTIPLQRYLRAGGYLPRRALPPAMQSDLRLCWDLHLLRPGGVPALLLVHASSRFSVLLCAPTPAGWAGVPGLAAGELRRVLRAEGLPEAFAGRYARRAATAVCTKTHGRRPVAFLNRAVDDLYALPAAPTAAALAQPLLDTLLNDVPCRAAGHEGVGTARVFLRRDMLALWEEKPE